jgi:hypothetical protein
LNHGGTEDTEKRGGERKRGRAEKRKRLKAEEED